MVMRWLWWLSWCVPLMVAVAGCEPPEDARVGSSAVPEIEILFPASGEEVELTEEGEDRYLDVLVVASVRGLAFVPPSEGAADVDGQGHFELLINGEHVEVPATRSFQYRSGANQFSPGDLVEVGVNLVSNEGQDLDQFDRWFDRVEVTVSGSGHTVEPPATAELRLVHASPDVGALDIYASGLSSPLARSLRYGEATAWREVPAGPVRVDVRIEGADPASEPWFSETLDIAAEERVTGVAAGVPDSQPDQTFRVLPVVEAWGNEVPGRARVRFVHAAPDLPLVAVDGARRGVVEVAPFTASSSSGETLEIGGGVQLGLTQAAGDREAITSFTTPELAQGDGVLLIATGWADALPREPEGLKLLAIGRGGPLEPILQDPQLFVLHGSGDSQLLELCSETQEVAANFNFGEMIPTRVSPGTYDLKIFNYPAGCTGAALNGTGNISSFAAGERYLMLLTGEQNPAPGEASIQAASFRDAFTLGDPANARVRFVHGASYTQVYVGVVGELGLIEAPNVLTPPIAWRVASAEVTVPPGPLLIGVADAVGTPPPPYDPIVTFDYAAQGGERQWGIVAGDPTPDDEDDRPLQVLVVDSAPDDWTVAVVQVNEGG